MRTIVVTGSASGMGAATRARLEAAGDRVIGVDVKDADVVADLGTAEGRQAAIDGVKAAAGDSLDGIVTWAGLPGLTERPGSLLVSVNYFGTVVLLEGLRPLLAKGNQAAAVAISSNSTTIQPGLPLDVTEACLSGDEDAARAAGDAAGSLNVYPASKLAIARWVRRNAPAWAEDGITLNAVAPGAVETPLLQASRGDETVGSMVDLLPIPTGKAADPDQIAAFVQFLLGPDARFFCGSVVFIDGGTDALLRANDMPVPMPG
jgi:NAD(P)-dependent dehydrogenase (short-subunit alcohol dehydrogenase family)